MDVYLNESFLSVPRHGTGLLYQSFFLNYDFVFFHGSKFWMFLILVSLSSDIVFYFQFHVCLWFVEGAVSVSVNFLCFCEFLSRRLGFMVIITESKRGSFLAMSL